MQEKSILDLFAADRERHPDRPLFTFVNRAGEDEHVFTPDSLATEASRVRRLLDEAGFAPGDRAILAYPHGPEFIAALVGCFMAGVIPAPVLPPVPGQGRGNEAGFIAAVRDCRARGVLTCTAYDDLRKLAVSRGATTRGGLGWPEVPWYPTDRHEDSDPDPERAWHSPASIDETALLQYTSGSTGTPRGVVMTHRSLIAEVESNTRDYGMGPHTVGVSWLPHYHDFGLIAVILNGLSGSGHMHLLSPLDFIRSPAIWFETMSRVGANGCPAPNFAFDLSVRRTTPQQRRAWDLSHMEVVMSAGEPILPRTIDRFFAEFAVTGLRPETFCPTYGLAEAALSVSSWGRMRLTVDADALAEGKVVPLDSADTEAARRTTTYFGCGQITKPGSRVRIIDPETHLPCPEDRVGEIWVDSPTKGAGYLGRAAETASTFYAKVADGRDIRGYLRTGDMGFFADGELFITGRLKDVIIVRGRNYHAEDLEESVRRCHPHIRPGGIAAFSVTPPDGGAEQLVVFAETSVHTSSDHSTGLSAQEIADAVRKCLRLDHLLSCDVVVVGGPGLVAKTTSGKVRRRTCKSMYLAGEIPNATTVRGTGASEHQLSGRTDRQ
ncbi:fatty acyl-AMP ligase [Nocardia sp. NPDC051570]|uniref:fatty acyl-AMP ligase n=1 Tax=Nocardia sp. NPDC051570 TaxID=3364324 RepID=UPI00379D9F09